MKSIEHDEQKKLMDWWAEFSALHGLPIIALFAIPNGGERNIIVATRMKAEGVRRGVPDLFLALPKRSYHGLFIELKKPKGGKVSEHQKEYIKYLAWHGTQSERLKQLQQAFGFLIDFHEMTINNIPDKLISNTDFSAYVNNDLITENITKVVWQDGLHTYEAGSEGGAFYGIDSPCACDDSTVAERCLKYYKYQQNYISITIPYDPRIRHHSVINVIKNATSIPCMVEKYNINFFTNEMELECHWI